MLPLEPRLPWLFSLPASCLLLRLLTYPGLLPRRRKAVSLAVAVVQLKGQDLKVLTYVCHSAFSQEGLLVMDARTTVSLVEVLAAQRLLCLVMRAAHVYVAWVRRVLA